MHAWKKPCLVAGEAQDDKALVLVLVVQSGLLLVLWGEAASRCHVDDEHHLASVLIHVDGLAVRILQHMVVDHGVKIYVQVFIQFLAP